MSQLHFLLHQKFWQILLFSSLIFFFLNLKNIYFCHFRGPWGSGRSRCACYYLKMKNSEGFFFLENLIAYIFFFNLDSINHFLLIGIWHVIRLVIIRGCFSERVSFIQWWLALNGKRYHCRNQISFSEFQEFNSNLHFLFPKRGLGTHCYKHSCCCRSRCEFFSFCKMNGPVHPPCTWCRI